MNGEAIKRAINEYLFYECYSSEEGDEVAITAGWPYELHHVGTAQLPQGNTNIFQFEDAGEEFYVLAGRVLSFLPVGGMSLDALRLQEIGKAWIGDRDPIDLRTVRVGAESVPTTRERREAITHLATEALGIGTSNVGILEGLFLQKIQTYLALIQTDTSDAAVIIGGLEPHLVGYPETRPWRRLALGVGALLSEGRL